jgi:hypothetical protein
MNLSPEALPPFRSLPFRRFLTTSSKVLMTSSFVYVVPNVVKTITYYFSPHTLETYASGAWYKHTVYIYVSIEVN